MQRNTIIAYTKFDPSVETVYLEDTIMQFKERTKYNDFDKLCFCDDPQAQMDNGAKCSITNIVKVLGM